MTAIEASATTKTAERICFCMVSSSICCVGGLVQVAAFRL
jgi:hypothetical protein